MTGHNALVDAWYNLLNGISVPVYRVDVPEEEEGNYVILRAEGGNSVNNKSSLNDEMVIITDIVTVFENNIKAGVVEGIDAEIFDRVLPTSKSNVLFVTGLDITNVTRENFDYVTEQDGVNKYYRKVSRYRVRVHQT